MLPNTAGVRLLDIMGTIDFDDADTMVIGKRQEIPQEFVQANRRQYLDSGSERGAENFHKVASIPTIFVEEMMKDGINLLKDDVPYTVVVGWLKRKGLDGFLTSSKV